MRVSGKTGKHRPIPPFPAHQQDGSGMAELLFPFPELEEHDVEKARAVPTQFEHARAGPAHAEPAEFRFECAGAPSRGELDQ